MHRFKHVYEDGGLIPSETFLLGATLDKSDSSGLCLTYEGMAGTSPNGQGVASLQPCNPDNERQRWHGANRDIQQKGQPCCSGLRAWNTDQCIRRVSDKVQTFVCDVSGKNSEQAWHLDPNGQLRQKGGRSGFLSTMCVAPAENGHVRSVTCNSLGSTGPWKKDSIEEPIESQLYRKAISDMTNS